MPITVRANRRETPGGSTLRGWQLNEANTGLTRLGIDRNTLPEYTGPAQLARGTVISDMKITVPIEMYAGDCTLERCWIAPTYLGYPVGSFVTTIRTINDVNTQSVVGNNVVQDCEIDGDALPLTIELAEASGFSGIGSIRRNYWHGMGSAIAIITTGPTLSGVIEGNYVTGLRAYGDPATTGSHNEAATVRDFPAAPGRSMQWIGNRLHCETGGNDSGGLFIQPLWGDIANVDIRDNYIEGGGYNLYVENKDSYVYSNITVENNRLRPTGWGPVAVSSGVGWAAWSENYLYDAADPDGKGAIINQ